MDGSMKTQSTEESHQQPRGVYSECGTYGQGRSVPQRWPPSLIPTLRLLRPALDNQIYNSGLNAAVGSEAAGIFSGVGGPLGVNRTACGRVGLQRKGAFTPKEKRFFASPKTREFTRSTVRRVLAISVETLREGRGLSPCLVSVKTVIISFHPPRNN
ncbi:hypothetical protein EYF80_032165 [Liparis tanakae]|uniref:Uncharacterized protein n=1 Tax=Liparis tanakae TaxID=230148 RepID=A0A4Z2GX06_9TELE|nr:hypothetical protein EYF80_032165 [Liparis tanakae]